MKATRAYEVLHFFEVTIMVYIDEKWTVVPMKLKLVGELLDKRY